MLRKYFLTSVMLVVTPLHDTLLQVYLGLLVCVAFALLVARHRPYVNPLCGQVQLLCLTQLAFTYMSGMLFFDDGGSSSARWWAENEQQWGWLLLAINLLVFVVLGGGLCVAVRGAAREAVDDVRGAKQRHEEAEKDLHQIEGTAFAEAESEDKERKAHREHHQREGLHGTRLRA